MMIDFFIAYRPLIDLFLLHTGYALGQYLVLRSGTFSIGSAGLTAIGAYTAASLTVKLGLPVPLSILVGTVASVLVSMLLAWPLTRLRGVYQAIATLAFVQVVLSLNIYAEGITGGAMGLSGIPKAVGTWTLLISVALALVTWAVLRYTPIGKAMRAMAENPKMAAAFGVNEPMLALFLSGAASAFAGVAGACLALSFTLAPSQIYAWIGVVFSAVMIGGLGNPIGPLVAGIVIGMSEAATMAVTAPAWAPLVSFTLLIAVLILRPGKI